MVSRQRVAQQWIVRANGVECARIRQGRSVEIGRRPIRPIADDGHERVEVDDADRSMSKRHALVTVGSTGSAVVRDLHSTNGTFVVGSEGGLTRLQPDADFLLPASPMRLQFGDVRMDFIRIEEPDDGQDAAPVRNLFGSASPAQSSAGSDLASLPVDDILNVRVGEPTVVFRTADARQSPEERRQQASATEQGVPPLDASPIAAGAPADDDADDAVGDAEPDDAAPLSEGLSADQQVADGSRAGSGPASDSASEPVDGASASDVDQSAASSVPLISRSVGVESEPRDLFADAKAAKLADGTASGGGDAARAPRRPLTAADDGSAAAPSLRRAPEGRAAAAARSAASSPTSSVVRASAASAASAVGLPSEGLPGASPVFEPGSIFARVKKGEFDRRRPSISVGGFTSDRAMVTTDYDEQCGMARHVELLPFLAMNPSLYDALYDWLARHRDADIDAALESNPGYREHRLSGKK